MEQMPGHRILGDRYEMTRRIDQCGETIVYLGRDAVSGRMVTVREFCPSPIMRQDARGQILVQPGCEVQYKSLSSDYEELCRYLMGLPAELPRLFGGMVRRRRNAGGSSCANRPADRLEYP